jgi:formylglycine-generating enzyme required for sulfatase activity
MYAAINPRAGQLDSQASASATFCDDDRARLGPVRDDSIPLKLQAAKDAGITRVVLCGTPDEKKGRKSQAEEYRETAAALNIRVVGAKTFNDAYQALVLRDIDVSPPPDPLPNAEECETAQGRIRLTLIRGGEFLRGATLGDKDAKADERPQQKVKLTKNFYLGVHPVTVDEYYRVLQPASRKRGDHRPITEISWMEAIKFCNQLSDAEGLRRYYRERRTTAEILELDGPGYRLPTEAEWEYACRAGGRWQWEDLRTALDRVAWYGANAAEKQPVQKRGPNPWGLYDMLGNVWEWCWDWYARDYYHNEAETDPVGPKPNIVFTATGRVIRGGSFHSPAPSLRFSARAQERPERKKPDVGFRIARSAPPQSSLQ